METIQTHILMGGPVVYPLIICSVLVLALLLERALVFAFYPPVRGALRVKQFQQGELPIGRGLPKGLALLNGKRDLEKSVRDEYASLWLQGERRALLAHTRWLTLLGAVAPLLGLLGTVLGIISMFQNVAHVTGPVTPALLAEGMWEAMVTTALGMLIAVPALIGSHGFCIWGDARIDAMAAALNECSLGIETGTDQGPVENVIKPAAFQGQLA